MQVDDGIEFDDRNDPEIELFEVCRCPTCGCEDLTKRQMISSVDSSARWSNQEFRLLECTSCRVLLTSPIPVPHHVPLLYANRDTVDFPATSSIATRLRKLSLSMEAKMLLTKCGSSGSGFRILDWGCGDGLLSEQFGFEGAAVTAVDFSSKPPSNISDRVRYQSFDQHSGTARYDLVIARHVFEHSYDPTGDLRMLLTKLTHDGSLYIQVPNAQCVGARIFKRNWEGWYIPRHITHWTSESLSSTLSEVSPGASVTMWYSSTPILAGTLQNAYFPRLRRLGIVGLSLGVLEKMVLGKFKNTLNCLVKVS